MDPEEVTERPREYDLEACPWCHAPVPRLDTSDERCWDERVCAACTGTFRLETAWQEGMDDEEEFLIGLDPP